MKNSDLAILVHDSRVLAAKFVYLDGVQYARVTLAAQPHVFHDVDASIVWQWLDAQGDL